MQDLHSYALDHATLITALQATVNGDDVDATIDEVLVAMTRRDDAARLFPDGRARRRIENRLRHASAGYARILASVFDLFKEAIEAEGLRVSPEFAGERKAPPRPLSELLAERGIKLDSSF